MDASLSVTKKLWGHSALVALGAFLFYVLYIRLLDGHFGVVSLAKTLAGTANFLLAASLSLSTFSYYFDFLDRYVVYRKYLGLLGFFAALLYALSLPLLRPERYFYGFFEHLWSSDIVLGLGAMGILAMMALISNNAATRLIGPARWRNLLRLGYLAFFLLVIRAVMNNEAPIGADPVPEHWASYLANPTTLPPPRLLFSVIAMLVLLGRLSVTVDQWQRSYFARKGEIQTSHVLVKSQGQDTNRQE